MKAWDMIMFCLIAGLCFAAWLAILWQVVVWAMGAIK